MTRYTLIVSDVHLCGVSPTGPAYRRAEHLLDDKLVKLIYDAISWSKDGTLEVIFNGDLFDFDAPDVRPLNAHRELDAGKLIGHILDDHPEFVRAVQNVIRARGTVIFIPGNHDAQLAFLSVRNVLRGRLGALHDMFAYLEFKSLFHRTDDGVHVEHGHQYDPLCCLRNVIPQNHFLEHTIGSIASQYAPELLGGNPYSSDPFDLDIQKIGGGAVVRLIQGLATMSDSESSRSPLIQKCFIETGMDLHKLNRHTFFFSKKMSPEEFIVSRVWLNHGKDLDEKFHRAEKKIAALYGAKGVVMGHTHRPHERCSDGYFSANTGSWTPDVGLKPGAAMTGSFVWIRSKDGKLDAGTYLS